MKSKSSFLITPLFFILLLFSCIDFVDSPYPALNVKPIPLISGLERATATSFVINDTAYITLGRAGAKHTASLNDCWQFNSTDSSWTRKADFPGHGRVGAIAEVVAGKAYVGFGYNTDLDVYASDTTIFPDFWMYDPLTNTWSKKANFPTKVDSKDAPVNSCSSFVYKNWIYLFSFSAQTHTNNEVWRYNTENNSWEQLSDFPGAPRTAAVSCTDANHYYYGLGSGNRNDWWEYFPETDKWTQRSSLPGKGRVNALAFSVNHRFFIATGRYMGGSVTTGQFFNDIMEFDALKNVWYKRGTIPTVGRENAIAFVLNNKAYIGFGETDALRFNDLWYFEP